MSLPDVGNQYDSKKFIYDYQISGLDIFDPAGQSKVDWKNAIVSYKEVGLREIRQDKLNDFLNVSLNAANGTQVSCSYCGI